MILQTLFVAGLVAGQAGDDLADVEGRWRLSLTLPIVQNAPVLGDHERNLRMSGLVDLSREQGELVQRTNACNVDIVGGGAARAEVPETFAYAIDVPPAPVERAPGGLSTELRDISIGYEPEAPGEPPPRDASSPALRDGDEDGDPGVTVVLRGLQLGQVKLFVALLLHLRLQGERESPTRWQGDVRVLAFEQSVLGSDPPLFGLARDITTRARDGRFTLERVPADTTCGSL